jgi:hypothetical protein
MKNFLCSLVLSTAVLICAALPAKAQDPFKPYTLLNGGTNKVTGLATNQAIYLNTSEYTRVTLQGSCSAPAGTSNMYFFVFRSINSSDYESTLYQTFVLPSASTTNTAILDFDVGGASSLKILPANTNGASFVSNLVLTARFKATKTRN